MPGESPSSEPCPSSDEEAAALWNRCYQGEVYGEAYLEQLLLRTESRELRVKIEALAAVERSTKELLASAMERIGIPATPDESVLGEARANLSGYEANLEAALAGAATFLDHYHRLRQLVGEHEASTVDLLIAHELAVEVFARRELAGDTSRSLQPLVVLPHVKR